MIARHTSKILIVLLLVHPFINSTSALKRVTKRAVKQEDTAENLKSYEANQDDENRIIISEPYKSLIQATARFAVAQTSLTDYVTVDTAMDVVSDAGYALSKPSTLSKMAKPLAVALVIIAVGAVAVPSSYMKALNNAIKEPERYMKVNRFLPRALNQTSIVEFLDIKSDNLLAKVGLNDETCRERTVCRLGELIRCSFPGTSKISINFISENLSRPKYKNIKYLNAFLSGFVDQSCVAENESLPANCASNLIKAFTNCPSQKSPPNSNCQ